MCGRQNVKANHDGDDNCIACFHVHVYASGLDATAERPVPPPPGERGRDSGNSCASAACLMPNVVCGLVSS